MLRWINTLTAPFGWFRRLWTKPMPSLPSLAVTASSSNSGQSAQSGSSVPNVPFEAVPVIASADSVPQASSTEVPVASPVISPGEAKVSITLSSIGAAISAAVVAAEGVTAEVAKVYTYAASAMADAETAYAKGTTKLASVLAAVSVVAADVGADWPSIQSDVTALITNVKAAYNNALTTTAASTTAATAATTTATTTTGS